MNLRVYPPDGRVRVSVPRWMSGPAVRAFLVTKLPWIRNKRAKFQSQAHLAPLSYVDGEHHDVWGQRYVLAVQERHARPVVTLGHGTLTLHVRPGSDARKRAEVVGRWYRGLVHEAVQQWLPQWEARLDVQVQRVFVQQMKTRWGSCNTTRHTLRLNTELAKKPRKCLEYVLVHELVHLLEPSHNKRFFDLMDVHMPRWKDHQDVLHPSALNHDRQASTETA